MYALYAAQEAVNHAGLDVEAIDKDRFGVIVASGIGGIKEIEDQVIRLHEKGPKRVKPMNASKSPTKIWLLGMLLCVLELMEFVNRSILLVPLPMMRLGMLSVPLNLVSKI